MLHKTQGIVLSIRKYSERYSIVQTLTSKFGRVDYLLPKVQSKRSKLSNMLFVPLSILNLEVEHLPTRDIQRLKEAEREVLFYEIGYNQIKTSLTFFLSEFLSRLLYETDNNEGLFLFLKKSVLTLEEIDKGMANFHIAFLLQFTRFVGIKPNMENYEKGYVFDLLNGNFIEQKNSDKYCLSRQESQFLLVLCKMNYRNMHLYKLSRNERNFIIDKLLLFYRLHLSDFHSLKSLDVLREIF